jgi:alpha-ketoglutarate-dependent taurine dioxygenase
VTGWKSLFAVGNHVAKINNLTPDESRRLQDWFLQMIVEEHDAQLRHRWENDFDVGTLITHAPPHKSAESDRMLFVTAIWDNRTVYHSAIFDYAGLGVRTGHRAVGIGEQPYLDENSLTRREALAKEADGGWEHF